MRWVAAILAVALVLASTIPVAGAAGGAPPVYSNMLTIRGWPVALCYPWLVVDGGLVNLATGQTVPAPGDSFARAYCDSRYVVAVGSNGVYVYDRATGRLVDAIPLGGMRLAGYSRGALALLRGSTVVVHFIGFNGDVAITAPNITSAVALDFNVVDGFPLIAYISSGKLYVANPVGVEAVDAGHARALRFTGRLIVVAGESIRVFNVTDAYKPSVAEVRSLYMDTPFLVDRIYSGGPGNLTVDAGGVVVLVDLAGKRWRILGAGVPTRAGLYSPSAGVTYVEYDGSIYAVPGYAVARMGPIAVAGYRSGNGSLTVLWPLARSLVHVGERVKGSLAVWDGSSYYIVRVDLEPGTYILPLGSILATSAGVYTIDRPEVFIGPHGASPQAPINASIVRYVVARLPGTFSPVDVFRGVKYVASGGGRLLLILRDRAVIYGPDGVETVIPGEWLWGVVGDGVALYDGSTIRVYDPAGNPVAAYTAYRAHQPLYGYVKGGAVVLYYPGKLVEIGPQGPAERSVGYYGDSRGLRVTLTQPPTVVFGGFRYPLTAPVLPTLNLYQAAWSVNGTWYVLDVSEASIYIVEDAIQGVIYPLGHYLALDRNGTVYILPFYSWIVKNCYVHVKTIPGASILVNGVKVGAGEVYYYAECGARLNITASKPYYIPATATVIARPGGVNITLTPKPMIARVRVLILPPQNLPVESVVVRVGNATYTWANNETVELVAGYPYNITVLSFRPYDFCVHPHFINVRFKMGNNTLLIPCQLRGSVLGIHSNVSVQVTVKSGKNVVTAVFVPGGKTVYAPLGPGVYNITAKAVAKGYAERRLTVTLPPSKVVVVDVTPYKHSKLIVVAIPPTAIITVIGPNGKIIARGTAPLNASVQPGDYLVSAVAPGFKQASEKVTVKPGEEKVVRLVLQPLAPTAPPKKPIWMTRRFQILSIVVVAAAVAAAIIIRKRREARVVAEEIEAGEEGVEGEA